MAHFHYQDNQLFAESVPLATIAAQFGTPCYVYSSQALKQTFQQYDDAFATHDRLICYAVKANPNLSILKFLAHLGAGFDIVSGGELQRVLAIGGDPDKIVFSGVGKTSDEIRLALTVGIHCFNVESENELTRINTIAKEMGKTAPISLRVNPDVDAKTHPYIATGLKENKFGIAFAQALQVYRKARTLPNLNIIGIDCHIGSQLTEISPFIDALEKILQLIEHLRALDIHLQHLDLGGGIGIKYSTETPPNINDYAQAVLNKLANHDLKIILEPGRSIVGNAGVLLTKVEYLKPSETKHFAIVDAAMNDLMRPALYDAWHEILPVKQQDGNPTQNYEIVGPVCESGDFLGRDRALALAENDLLAIMSAGAYGMSMSSNYNTRPRAAEIIVENNQFRLIRSRETYAQLFEQEISLL